MRKDVYATGSVLDFADYGIPLEVLENAHEEIEEYLQEFFTNV